MVVERFSASAAAAFHEKGISEIWKTRCAENRAAVYSILVKAQISLGGAKTIAPEFGKRGPA